LPLSTAQAVGLRNFQELFDSGDLGGALSWTLKYVVWTLPTGIVLSLLFAYLLNTRLAGQRLWRFLYFSPLVTSVVSVALIFSQLFLFGPQGWLNAALLSLGWIKDPVPFLLSEHTFLDCVIVLAIWHGLAFTILVFLAGLQQVPNQLFEAAHLDGAGATSRFWHVALPGIRPQVFFVTVLGVIGSFQVFETIYTLAGKGGDAGARFGPNDAALTVVPLIFHKGFEAMEMGKAAAAAYVLFVLVLALTLVQVLVYQRGDRA
ncbi:MAG: sugar ABC transporter permease, partial [Nitrospirae bacterium]|nr:sugar ABC transporter permease [Fimbriimonadaceae bacterium]